MHHENDVRTLRAAVLTMSDTRGKAEDKSGKLIHSFLEEAGFSVEAYSIIKDDRRLIEQQLNKWAENPMIQAVIMNGGTGVSPKDVTYEAVASLLDKELHGYGELFRMLSYEEIGAKALFSRAIGGSIGSTAVFALPGSSNAVQLGMEKLIIPSLPHLIGELTK
ncbi:molybdenum cofactor biosynthesis protein B [Sinobaca sp. H24]|uniref:MogA/MoaB family molybdenum cofactor biosynthesis protein n=1 Tax=Sinobaca sp. H24 TaxID=2923376 RepID=UPI002079FDA4|nr:MogA/MoaB family molybdenum cofactor biosynthesis protein [Sinobaca sp. H24]